MSLLPPEINAALTQLLDGLSSPDNNARALAEEQLNSEWVAKRPDVLLTGLVEQMQKSHEPSVRLNPPCRVDSKNKSLTNRGSCTDTIIRSCTFSAHRNKSSKATR